MKQGPVNGSEKKMKKAVIIDFSITFSIVSFFVYYFTLFLVKIFDRLVYGISIKGRENIRRFAGKGCFLISNHSLYLKSRDSCGCYIPMADSFFRDE